MPHPAPQTAAAHPPERTRRRTRGAAAGAVPCLLALALPALGQDGGETREAVEAVRGIDRMGTPSYEFGGAAGTVYDCEARDAGGALLAAATVALSSGTGVVMFPALGTAAADHVACTAR